MRKTEGRRKEDGKYIDRKMNEDRKRITCIHTPLKQWLQHAIVTTHMYLEGDDEFHEASDSSQSVSHNDTREPSIEQWSHLLPLQSVVEPLLEESSHHLNKVRRLDERPHVQDGRDGGENSDTDIESSQPHIAVDKAAI